LLKDFNPKIWQKMKKKNDQLLAERMESVPGKR